MRAPRMTRLSTSRPSQSVPKGCSALGACIRAATSITPEPSPGLGASHGPKMAMISTIAMTISPKSASQSLRMAATARRLKPGRSETVEGNCV